MTKRKPEKGQCRCVAFCIEDTARTGRFCKLEHATPKNTDAPHAALSSKEGLTP
jgi:hypothetical protein